MVSVIICSLVLTIVLYAIFEKLQDNNRLKACILEGTLLTGVVLVYACVCVYEYNDVYFVAGMTLLLYWRQLYIHIVMCTRFTRDILVTAPLIMRI